MDVETGGGFNRNLQAMGWYFYNNDMQNSGAVKAYENGTKPVAKKQANAWGLYDMHGKSTNGIGIGLLSTQATRPTPLAQLAALSA